jgi:hypothetical protein
MYKYRDLSTSKMQRKQPSLRTPVFSSWLKLERSPNTRNLADCATSAATGRRVPKR